jgi:hypothetical protein
MKKKNLVMQWLVFLLVMLGIPSGVSYLHLLWPGLFWLKLLAIFLVLVFGSLVLWAMVAERPGGSFSLPLLYMLIIVVGGIILANWYGWHSTAIIMTCWAAVCLSNRVFVWMLDRNDKGGRE